MKTDEKGFTLIELLVVTGIIGILAAIAIPQYSAYRVRAFNATAASDLRNALTAEEAAFVDDGAYASCANALACEVSLPQFNPSKKQDGSSLMAVFECVSAGDSYTAQALHLHGDTTFSFDSTVSGSIAES